MCIVLACRHRVADAPVVGQPGGTHVLVAVGKTLPAHTPRSRSVIAVVRVRQGSRSTSPHSSTSCVASALRDQDGGSNGEFVHQAACLVSLKNVNHIVAPPGLALPLCARVPLHLTAWCCMYLACVARPGDAASPVQGQRCSGRQRCRSFPRLPPARQRHHLHLAHQSAVHRWCTYLEHASCTGVCCAAGCVGVLIG